MATIMYPNSTYTTATATPQTIGVTYPGVLGNSVFIASGSSLNVTLHGDGRVTRLDLPVAPNPVDNNAKTLATAIQTFGLKHKRDCNPWETCVCGILEIERLCAQILESTDSK